MKKILQIWLLTVIFGLWISMAQSSNLMNWLDDLSSETTFWYNETIAVSITWITAQKVVIQSPMIVDTLGTKITRYTVMYSEYTMDEIINDTALINNAKEKTFNFSWTETVLNMELNLYDNIDPTKVYYVRVIPKDQNDIWWQISTQDMWFKLTDQTYGNWVYTGSTHWSAWANMSLANISHSCTPDCLVPIRWRKTITLSWIAVAGSDQVDIFLQDGTDGAFNKLATVNMSTETYDLQTSRNWEHIFKFLPNNGWTEIHYTVNIWGISAGTGHVWTGITRVPKTWPATNLIIILFITLGWYLGYKKLYRKH